MPDFKFIHAADLHLGAPFVGLHEVNPRVAQAADRATYAAFEKIIQLALAQKVLFVLFSGDIFDAEQPNLWAQLRFRDGIRQLDAAGIQSCVIRGNHDHGGSVLAQLEFPDSYYEFPAGASEPHLISEDDVPVAEIYGYSYPQRAVTENILPHYALRSAEREIFRIGMLHGNVGGDAAHDNYAPCSVAQLKEIAIDCWALGHVHQAKVLSAAEPIIVYPGTPQGLSPRETGKHGCYLITVQNDRNCDLEFVPTDSMRWVNLQCDIEKITGEDALLQTLEHLLEEQLQQENCSLIARIDLVGRGTLHHSLTNSQTLAALREQLNAQTDAAPLLWVDRLQNLTGPDIDLEKKRRENNLLGDYLRLCGEMQTGEELQQQVLGELEEIFQHATVREALGFHGTAEMRQWLAGQMPQWTEQSEILGADLLLGEDAS